MGNDGGSIPKRSEVVKQQKTHVDVDKKAKAIAKSTLCSISKEPLRKPIVVCRRGLLYNKELLIKRLLEKNMPNEFRHITKLSRDTCSVADACISTETSSAADTTGKVYLQCAISQQSMNGIAKFYIAWGCGCVLSE